MGFTVTKQTGNSPERNRIRRRLRAAAKACENRFEAQHDYVLIGRRDVTDLPPVAIGESALLWGPDLPVEDMAERAGTIPYELLCGLRARVPREIL